MLGKRFKVLTIIAIFSCIALTLNSTTKTTNQSLTKQFVLGNIGLSDSSNQTGDTWPMFMGGLNHTGTVNTTPVVHAGLDWSTNVGVLCDAPVAVANGSVYGGGMGPFPAGSFFCLNSTTGIIKWHRDIGEVYNSGPAVAGDRVYVGIWDNKTYCFNATTGTTIWSYTMDGFIESSPAIAYGLLFTATDNGTIYCLNATNGNLVWSNATGYLIDDAPAVVNGLVYVGSGTYKMYCFDAFTGAPVWEFRTGLYIESSPVLYHGFVFFGSDDGKMYCLNATTGSLVWSYLTPMGPFTNSIFSSPAIVNDKLYFGGQDYIFFCLNATTGVQLWNYTTGDRIGTSPAVSCGYVYFASFDHRFICLNATTGKLIWFYSSFTMGGSCTPAIVDGHVYFSSYDEHVYKIPMVLLSVPYQPNNLVATGEHGGIRLTWSIPDVDGGYPITDYAIYRGTSAGSETFLTTAGNVATFTDTTGYGGVVYYYKIAAINFLGDGINSSEVHGIMITPLGINSDADWSRYSSGGDGSVGNPWIIAGFNLDCQGQGSGIVINNTHDHAILENIAINNTGNAPFNCGILMENVSNVNMRDILINNSLGIGIAVVRCQDLYLNLTTIDNAISLPILFDNSSHVDVINSRFLRQISMLAIYPLPFPGDCYWFRFINCTFSTQKVNATAINLVDMTGCHYLDFINCTFINGTSMRIEATIDNLLVENCTMLDYTNFGITLLGSNETIQNCNLIASKYRPVEFSITIHGSTNVLIKNNMFTGIFQTAVEGSTNSNVTYSGNIVSRDLYDKAPPANENYASGFETGTTNYLTISGNFFYNCSPAIAIINGINPVVVGNYFNDHLNDLGGVSLYTGGSVYTWNGNFYRDYFNFHPFDVTKNLTTNILQHPYLGSGINDVNPRYYSLWYPRAEVVYLEFVSIVTGTAISFDELVVSIDGIRVTTQSPLISHVLFRLTITLPNGLVFHDREYNVNVTDSNLHVTLKLVPQVFLSLYSTFDYFGVDPILTKLYINGSRSISYEPRTVSQLTYIVIKDFANVTLYSELVNFSNAGINLDIGLPVVTVIITNYFNYTVNFFLQRNNVTVMRQMPASSSLELRLGTGSYYYWVENTTGTTIVQKTKLDLANAGSITLGGIVYHPLPYPAINPILYVYLVAAVVMTVVLSVFFSAKKIEGPKTQAQAFFTEKPQKTKRGKKSDSRGMFSFREV